MALFDFLNTGQAKGDSVLGNLWVRLKDAFGNGIGKQHRELIPANQEALLIAGKNDQVATILRTDRKGNLITGNYIPELYDQFEGATLNARKWTQVFFTFTQAMGTLTGINLTSNAITTSGAYSTLLSQRLFQKIPRMPLQIKQRLRHTLLANSYADFGFGIPTTTTLIVPNGVSFRMISSGVLQGAITYNGVTIAIDSIISQVASNGNTIGQPLNMSNSYYTSNYFVYDLIIDDDNTVFTIQDTQTSEFIGVLSLPVPNSAIKMFGATSLPQYSRVVNSGVPTASPIFIISEMQVLSTDWNVSMSASEVAGNLGMSQGSNPYTGASLANFQNSTAPVSATLSNTAGSYAVTVKDGKFQFAAVAGSETHYALFGWQVPTGAKFLIEGIRIETYNTGTAVATTATLLEWGIGINGSAVTLANAGFIKLNLGVQSFAIGDPVGKQATVIDIDLKTSEVCESGKFINLILNVPIGTATASQIIRGIYTLKGRFI